MPPPPPHDIALLEEARLARAVSALAPVSEPIAGGVMCRAERGSWMNKAINLGMSGVVSAGDIAALIRFYEGAGIEPRVEVCPYSNESLIKGLADAGFGVRRFAHVVAMDLPAAPIVPEGADVPGLSMGVVNPADDDGVRLLARTLHHGFTGADAAPPEAMLEAWTRVVRKPQSISVLATICGQPAGAGFVSVHDRYATLYAASVLPEFRGRGVQSAMIAERLRLAAARGAAFATVTSDPEGPTERNARRLGFTPCYTRLILTRPSAGLTGVA